MKNDEIIEKLEKIKNVIAIEENMRNEFDFLDNTQITDSMMLGYVISKINEILEGR